MLGPDFFATSEQFHATPLMVDKNGNWMADYNVMASYDSNQNIKGSLRPLIARALNGDTVTEREIQDATMDALENTFRNGQSNGLDLERAQHKTRREGLETF